jgi:hypothetical protein
MKAFRTLLETSPALSERLRNLERADPQYLTSIVDVDIHGNRLVTPNGVHYYQDYDGFVVQEIQMQGYSVQSNLPSYLLLFGAYIFIISFLIAMIMSIFSPKIVSLAVVGCIFGIVLMISSTSTKTTVYDLIAWDVALTRPSSSQPRSEVFPIAKIESEEEFKTLESHLSKFLPRVT